MIVSTAWLSEHLNDPNLAIVDVRNVTNEPDAGYRKYRDGHIPGAVFLNMDTDLADRSALTRGRHPLPHPRDFVGALGRVGIGPGKRVIAYDDSAGSNAARLWWMMRWIGEPGAAILDGGITKWIHEGRSLATGEHHASPAARAFETRADNGMVVDIGTVKRAAELGLLLIDARSAERYRGEREPIDARAGRIPSAVNVPWEETVTKDPDPVLRSHDELRDLFFRAGVSNPSLSVCYCGSGVTSCLVILAMEVAGLRGARLYPGSWSEWIAHY